jgi:hypothetical protein
VVILSHCALEQCQGAGPRPNAGELEHPTEQDV